MLARNLKLIPRLLSRQVAVNFKPQLVMPSAQFIKIQNVRFFSDETEGEKRVEMYPIDPRISRFSENRFRVYDIPEGVTEDQIREKFAEHGEVRQITYHDNKDREDQGPVCYVVYGTAEEGRKAKEAFGEEIPFESGAAKLHT